jgi:hypothetical protein
MPKAHRTTDRERKALQRVKLARTAYTRAENRLGALRLRLDLAERKLARRAERLAGAEADLAALASVPMPSAPESSPESVPATAPAAPNGAKEKTPGQSARRKTKPEQPV